MTDSNRLPPPRRGLLAIFIACVGWAIAGAVIALQVVRWLGGDLHTKTLIGLSTAWPLVTISGLLVVLLAGYLRRLPLMLISLLLIAIVAAAWWPAWFGRVGPGPSDALGIRILAVNVEKGHDTGGAAQRLIQAEHPDIVVISELTPLTLRHLSLPGYQYSWQRPERTAFGQGMWSRWPLTDASTWTLGGVVMVRLTVVTPNGPVRLYQVHTKAPTNRFGRVTWKAEFSTLKRFMAAERLPVIAAGDFNASRWDKPYSSLLGGPRGIEDAASGRGYLASWPSGEWMPLYFPLDHILISRGMGVRRYHVLTPIGSDHRGVIADLSLRKVGV